MMRPWALPVSLVLCGAAVAASPFRAGEPVPGAAVLLAFLPLAAVASPLVLPRSSGLAQARRRSAADGRPIVFWRPGCVYCLRLRARLGRDARRPHRVDIWRDPEGAAAVREADGGDETVPTVLADGRARTDPGPAWVRALSPRA
ncbi:glutaredoxin domain-containing protein [Streptomyces daghestanicus]|nr:glutaredoxin domain-containing protein [Streptomyces daghestanicus]